MAQYICMHILYSCTWPRETWGSKRQVTGSEVPNMKFRLLGSLSLTDTESVHMWSSFATQLTQSPSINVLLLSVHFPGWLWASNLSLEKVFTWTPSHYFAQKAMAIMCLRHIQRSWFIFEKGWAKVWGLVVHRKWRIKWLCVLFHGYGRGALWNQLLK